ncbi:MAG: GTPase Era [Deltaproteobacteria bacterium]|nr:GTPase Era [Deltaproteobacteria bacterium]
MTSDFKCGYVAIIGYPNVGKSTLLNELVGERLAITSPKPQTTRHRLLGVLNRPDAQLLFLDTPGILKPRSALHESLVKTVLESLAGADVVVWLVDPRPPDPGNEVLLPHLRELAQPLIVAINKIDLVAKPALLPLIAAYHETFPQAPVVPVSALYRDGLPALLEEIIKRLPAAPPLFPEDQLTDKTERFLVGELIRQRLLHHLGEEIPHAVAVVIEEFDESRRPDLVNIRAVIYVEKDSQKGIVIGKGGRVLKAVGQEAREEMEVLLDAKVYLDLWVKVWKNWRRDPKAIRMLGYEG